VAPDRAARWTIRQRHAGHTARPAAGDRALFDYRGFRVEQCEAGYSAHLIVEEDGPSRDVIEGGSLEDIQARIDRSIGTLPRAASAIGSLYLGGVQAAAATGTMMRRIAVRLSSLPGAEWNAAKALGRRTIDRMQRFGHERSRVSGSLASLIVNLHALRRRSDPALGGRRPVFLTDSRAVAYYLRALGQMGVVPRLDIVTVLGRDIGRWSEAASRQEGAAMLCIVARDVYARHHQAFTAAGISRRMTVL
jgi:hypothetical protein